MLTGMKAIVGLLLRTVGQKISESWGQQVVVEFQDVKERMLVQGATPHATSPADFDAFIKNEVERLAKVVKASGAKAD